MTTLLDKPSRDALGINTYPRAILWSALLLLKVNKNEPNNPYFNSVRIGIDTGKSSVVIEASLPYSRTIFINTGGDIVSALLSVSADTPYDDVEAIPPANPVYVPLPSVDDSRVNTLEKYFVWTAFCYKVGLRRYRNDNESINITFLDERLINGFPTVKVNAVLPFSFTKYFCYGNMLESVFEMYEGDPCAEGLLSTPGGFVILFSDDTVVSFGLP